jgi:polyisoprenoid-binding protein YceI
MTTAPTRTSTWQIDPSHSSAEFAVKHFMISTVKGRFTRFDGRLHIDEQEPENSWVEARIETASVETGVDQRDAHLRSDDFFNAEAYPYITFRSTRAQRVGPDRWQITGDLTIRDVTREVVLDTNFEGEGRDFTGNRRSAFLAETSIDRRDFGLKYNAVIEGGTVVVGDKVKISLNIEAALQELVWAFRTPRLGRLMRPFNGASVSSTPDVLPGHAPAG